VYEGLLQSTPDKFEVGSSLVRLWRNECLRVFHDRMIAEEDKEYVQKDLLKKLISGTDNLNRQAETSVEFTSCSPNDAFMTKIESFEIYQKF
jgi:hypothetical protein